MKYNATQVKSNCIKKWTNGFSEDKRISNFENTFDEWFAQIPDKDKQTTLVLLNNLKYYSRQTVNQWLQTLHMELCSHENVSEDNTIFAFIKSLDGKTNSSNDYWTEYKAINEINKQICFEDITSINDKQWGYIENIVFIDDFSGSGKSFIDELKKCPDRYVGKKVFFIAVNIMAVASEKINEYANAQNIDVTLIFAETQGKAFESDYFEDNEAAKDQICSMSALFHIPSREQCGYEDSQSLIAFYNNTPNNTLGFIRYDTDEYKSIFPRRNDKKPSWQQMDCDKGSRKKANYNNKSGR